MWDACGREFIDCRCALGPITLDYAGPTVDLASRAQLDDGILFGQPHVTVNPVLAGPTHTDGVEDFV